MKLFVISQGENEGYDTYDSAVVAAENEEAARKIHPSGNGWPTKDAYYHEWASCPENVNVICIGEAIADMPAGVLCASYNAG